MNQNTGIPFENRVFSVIEKLVESNEFVVSEPNVRVRRNARYYSRDRESDIECEISVEKYLGDPDINDSLRPAIIVIIECKDYAGPIPVSDIEEFHAKLQQIGADNTKGIMITNTGSFQKSALRYALSKGIALARILPDDQVHYILYMRPNLSNINSFERNIADIMQALTEKDYSSTEGERFFSLTGEKSLNELVCKLIKLPSAADRQN